ncbi:hypothetical protein B0F90DRAFT_1690458 [Multifurca ochricompacta]|uniref:Uncharacterized protein n=1 Tax=Multifurca ochricompacta TaxID=376703 RepID=A0AAD4MAJ3_9AGAM|nr:hypothetical protein B0F90DRAFT_1690458 [Multifurca ochricompacta]
MNTYKLWKPNTTVSLSQETDRSRHKHLSSSSFHHNKNSESRTTAREDARLRSTRGYVSDGPLPSSSSQTLAPKHPTGTTSLATANKPSHNTHSQPSQGHSSYVSQKLPLPSTPLPQETHLNERHLVSTHDPRAASIRAVVATEKSPVPSSDPIRHTDDHHKNFRHRHRKLLNGASESAEPQTTSIWPLSSSFLKKVSPESREKDKEKSRNKVKDDDPKAIFRSKERGRAERAQVQTLRDQRERDPRHEEERRRYKEERRRERERRKEEEQPHDEYAQKTTRDQERRHEARDGLVPAAPLGRDPRLTRVKDSDESDNSLMKPQGSVRPRRHQRDYPSTAAVVPTVLRQSIHPANSAQVPTAQSENNTPVNLNESRRATTSVQPPHGMLSASNERSSAKPHRSSPSQNLTVPYPPGYAVSASDSEHASRRDHRSKTIESGRSIERPRTSGGHRTSLAPDSISKPPPTQYAQPPLDKGPHKSEKQSKGPLGGWLFHRETSNTHSKSMDTHTANQNATQVISRAAPPPLMRSDNSDSIPQVVSIRAGEGPADYLQEFGARRATLPAVAPAVKDAVARQTLPTVQVLQQPQSHDKQPRGLPRPVASVQLDVPSQNLSTHVSSPQPWLQSAQWSTEPQPMSPPPRPAMVPSPVVFPASLTSLVAPVETQRHPTPARSAHHGSSSHQENTSFPANSRPPIPLVHSYTVPLPAVGGGQRASPQGASSTGQDVNGSKHPRHPSALVGYTNTQPSHVAPSLSRPIAPDLAAAFPVREDNTDTYHRHPIQGERPQDTQPSREIAEQWDRHGHYQDSTARLVVSAVPSSERTPRSTKASPSLHPRPPLTNPDLLHAHDPSRPGLYNTLNQNPNSSQYPATLIYPSSSPRTHVEASSAINNLPVANAPPNNPSPKFKSGNPSPRSRSQAVAPSQGPTPPVAAHITTRTPSHETGSTTLLGQTPSSQGSMSLLPMSPAAHPQAVVPRAGTHNGQQPVQVLADSLGDRYAHPALHSHGSSAARQTNARHYHSASAPIAPVSSLAPLPHARSQTQPTPRVSVPISPTPVRSYPTTQATGDPLSARIPVSGYTPAPSIRQQRNTIPSPSQESELNTPSSLAVSTKLPIVSDEPIAPVMSTQSYQEPKKKSGFFQGLGLFRSKSSAQKRNPHEAEALDPRAQSISTKLASSKPPAPLQYDSDSKLKKLKTTAATHTPAPAVAAPAPPPAQRAPMPVSTAFRPQCVRIISNHVEAVSHYVRCIGGGC